MMILKSGSHRLLTSLPPSVEFMCDPDKSDQLCMPDVVAFSLTGL